MLGHPLVAGALAVLVLNDHVLKTWSAGQGILARSVTGKASDVAGVLLLAVLVGALTGRRRASVLAVAIGFTALKLSPAVADLAVPVLGGRTRTDPWDLLALAALWPADRLLGRLGDRPAFDLRPAWASLRATLGVAVVVLSVPAMTATSPCPDPPTLALLVADEDGLLAAVGDSIEIIRARREAEEGTAEIPADETTLQWYRSTDGGSAWSGVALTADRVRTVAAPEPVEEDCLGDTCYRVERDEVQQRVGDGRWERSFAHSGRVAQDLPTPLSCPDDERLTFQYLAVDDGAVVVGNGTQGVIRRVGTGNWERIPLGGLDPVDLHPVPPFGTLLGVGLGLALLGTWMPMLTLSRRPPRRAMAAGVICWGGAIALGILAAVGLVTPTVARLIQGPVVPLLGLGIAAGAWTVVARSRPARPVRPHVGAPGTTSPAPPRDEPPSPWTD